MNNNQNNDGISFDIDRERPIQPTAKSSGMILFVIKMSGGLVKTKKQANHVLLAVVGVMIISSLFLVFEKGNKGEPLYGGGSNPQFIE